MTGRRMKEKVGSVPMLGYKSQLVFTSNLPIYTKTRRGGVVVQGGRMLFPALTSLPHTAPFMPNGLEE